MAIGAHPDDIELGCGATLAKLAAEGTGVRAIVLSAGRRGAENDVDRCSETRSALSLLGINDVVQFNFPDTELAGSLNEIIRELEKQNEEFNPVRLYTMFGEDRHQDHRAVYQASMVAFRNTPQVLGYETPSSFPHFVPTVFEQVEAFLERKIECLAFHESQQHRTYMQPGQVLCTALFRGVQANSGPSEGFIPYKMVL
jgi:LmbE family N-acetylglucosaminyl deacetylase